MAQVQSQNSREEDWLGSTGHYRRCCSLYHTVKTPALPGQPEGSFSGRKGSLRFIPVSDMEAMSSSKWGSSQILYQMFHPRLWVKSIAGKGGFQKDLKYCRTFQPCHSCAHDTQYSLPNDLPCCGKPSGSLKEDPGPRSSNHLRGQLAPRHCPTASYGGEPYSSATFSKTVSSAQDRPQEISWASKIIPEALT